MIDTHMHINSQIFNEQETNEKILKINNDNFITKVINVGLNVETSKEIIEISSMYGKFYNSVGIHPLYIDGQNPIKLCEIVSDKTVAIGEIGLDNGKANFYDQKRYLITQIFIANELHLPIIIHSSNSNSEIIKIFENYVKPRYGCVFHCFQPDYQTLSYLIENGFYISFAGKILSPNARMSLDMMRIVPENLFLIETDSPYIGPIYETSNINKIIEKVSQIKQVDFDKVISI